jgi:hypothetical protein
MKRLLSLILWLVLSTLGLGQEKKPDDKPALRIVNIQAVNSAEDDTDPHLAPDGLSLFFASRPKGKDLELMMSRRPATRPTFDPPRILDELNTKGDDFAPFLMPDNQYIYFTSASDAKNTDIFFSRRLRPTEPFQHIGIAPVHKVCTDKDEAHPWLSGDAREMYLSRKTAEGWRIFHASGTAQRGFEKMEMIDFPPGFHHPTLSRDMTVMYLQGPDEKVKEKSAIYVSRRSGKVWSKPELVPLLNNEGGPLGNLAPALSYDGRYLLFASDRPGGKGKLDIWFVYMDELRKLK